MTTTTRRADGFRVLRILVTDLAARGWVKEDATYLGGMTDHWWTLTLPDVTWELLVTERNKWKVVEVTLGTDDYRDAFKAEVHAITPAVADGYLEALFAATDAAVDAS